ncbi:uncharacterized protein BBA_05244 [Beauveria bassiana ARSEF 2860]|uniref:PhoD-like phosphatase domain-containing protein n=1 Tax=Beauveria bassiana (strain ARSEF 2860) TaxID=655819 RepID=J5JK70_BEAB2|nr:uncharacterized protein BBA_05244 [Beauveria bassiana ARSEF 2860]EJP65833.1 hypothetical protein BBA_05244 [Beauveria bassiana ARSEF 2860]
MSAQNWGDLPKHKRGGHQRRSSEYEIPPTEQRQSLDSQPPRRTNRASIQTAYTEAPSESIFAPGSPTASCVTPQGLAPRPPSYQRAGFTDFAPDSSDHKPRRMPYDEDEYFLQASPSLPEAPDLPRGPPVSFREPYVPIAMPQTMATRHDPVSRYQPHTGNSNEQSYSAYPAMPLETAHAPMTASAADDARRGVADVSGQPRRTSTSTTSDRRKMLATNRSPLQNLELTLDSMTKEEKRARVEAAEQRARQRAAKNDQASSGSAPANGPITPQDVGTRQPIQQALPRQQAVEKAAAQRPRPAAHRDWTQQMQPDSQTPFSTKQQPAEEPDQPQGQPSSNIPQRNLSFKDRAARSPVAPRDAEMLDPIKQRASPLAPPNTVNRTGSNRIGQEPQDKFQQYRRIASEAVPRNYSPLVPVSGNALSRSARNKELPPIPVSDDRNGNHGMRDLQQQQATNDATPQGIQRRATEPNYGRQYVADQRYPVAPAQQEFPATTHSGELHSEDGIALARRRLERADSDDEPTKKNQHRLGNMLYSDPDTLRPGEGLYKPPAWLDEWEKAAVGTLSGPLLDVHTENSSQDAYRAWWEGDKGRHTNATARLRKAEAFDGEYDDTTEPTRFKPQLYLKCGPLLRYCGIRKEAIPSRSQRGHPVSEREMWRGSIMIVTKDSDSSYEIAPMLRLFVQDIGVLPPAPHHIKGDLSPEYVDPIAGHPKLGRRGETLYVRPVEHLQEGKDLSMDETENGLFEMTRSPPDVQAPDGAPDLPGSFASRKNRAGLDGEKAQKYKDVRGFRLHTERGYTFWRFNVEIELRQKQQRIAYRINRGPCMAFWVPPRGQTMNIMFHSCNGFSLSAKPDDFSGPDPMWRDVLNTHQTKPFHVMIGGGDQIYNDCVADICELFGDWLDMRNPFDKHHTQFTPEMQNQLEEFYLERYCMWFSQGLFGLATSQIPMVNMYDDHDVFDGYGSYPDHDMKSPVFSGLGAVAFKYYMLFQHQSVIPETETSEPSWILGLKPGPYIHELSRSIYVSMGGKTALLAVDTRTERTEHEVIDEKTWEKITSRLYLEVRKGQVEHLLVLLGVPIAYPRMVWLENILTSRLMDPVKALGRAGVFGKMLNNIDGGVEVLDDLNDHWTAKHHKQERSIIVEDLQDLAMDKSVRVTILSGDVHVAAVGQFYSNPQLGLVKHKDPRYMPNIISSAIVNTPPPDILADVLNKRNKVHHFDKNTDENMIPLFQHGPDGKPRNNKHLLPHRNWCSIRQWSPGTTPPPTPPASDEERSASPPRATGGGGMLRRFSLSKRSGPKQFDGSRESVRGPRPPISGGLFRSLTRRSSEKGTASPVKVSRSMSLGSTDRPKTGIMGFMRRGSQSRAAASDDDVDSIPHWGASAQGRYPSPYGQAQDEPLGLRGGALTNDEYSDGDDAYFTPGPPQLAKTGGSQPASEPYDDPRIRPFHRTPTGLTSKQMKKAQNFSVDLEGGLDICLNVEVSPKDPTGITTPYRILVPRLYYEYVAEEDSLVETQTQSPPQAQPTGFKRFLSFRKKGNPPTARYDEERDSVGEPEQDSEDDSTEAGTVRRRY